MDCRDQRNRLQEGVVMLDYNLVKKFHAKKLAEDAEGDGRVESAFYHTMKMVYLKGVEDGQRSAEVGIEDRRLENDKE
jgi:hypothetical protein